jgi:hypothetical protein
MKKYIFLFLAGISFSTIQSQEITDAIRYSQENLTGTARFRAMSGAFGALGGDLSAINVNPAGSAVFSNNQIASTLSNNNNTSNNSHYFGTNSTSKDTSFDLNQAGGVFVFKDPNNNWQKIAVAINFENANSFGNSLISSGTNPNHSVADYFLSYANGVPLKILYNSTYGELNYGEQQAFLGYNAYIIDPVNASDPSNSNNTSYISNVLKGGNYYQENTSLTTGFNGKLSFNAATSYKDKIYLGVNLNSHFTDFRQSSSFYEDNNNTLESVDRVNRLKFENDLYTHGTGFSFQLGAIAKVSNEVRLGLAYTSPTWYSLSDELSQKLVAVSSNTSGELDPDVVDPQITSYFSPYKLQTPSKITGSFAYVFGKSGLISIDYAVKDYSATKFKPENDSYYSDLNNTMSTILNSTGELRIGGEYKINEWSLRGGYRFEQSPYKNTATMGDLTGYSGGFGYNFGSTKLDLAYSTAKRNTQQGFFSQGFTDGASINSKNNVVTVTLLFEL